jgi:hypothetical protein
MPLTRLAYDCQTTAHPAYLAALEDTAAKDRGPVAVDVKLLDAPIVQRAPG